MLKIWKVATFMCGKVSNVHANILIICTTYFVFISTYVYYLLPPWSLAWLLSNLSTRIATFSMNFLLFPPPPSALSLAAPPTILCLFFWKPPKILSKKNNTARENQSPRTKSLSQPLYVTSVCYRLRLFVILSFCRRFSSVHYYYYYIPIYLCFKCISWNSLY